jgi:hypothetical protein
LKALRECEPYASSPNGFEFFLKMLFGPEMLKQKKIGWSSSVATKDSDETMGIIRIGTHAEFGELITMMNWDESRKEYFMKERAVKVARSGQ